MPDGEWARVDNSELTGCGTRKLRNGEKDEEASSHHDCVVGQLEQRRRRSEATRRTTRGMPGQAAPTCNEERAGTTDAEQPEVATTWSP